LQADGYVSFASPVALERIASSKFDVDNTGALPAQDDRAMTDASHTPGPHRSSLTRPLQGHRAWRALFFGVAACSYPALPQLSNDSGIDSAGNDAPSDSGPSCFGSGAFEVCTMGEATGTQTLTGNLDTTDSNLCASTQHWKMAGQTTSCFVVAANVTIDNVSVTGSRPLVVIAGKDVTVTGHLDAASHIATTPPVEGPGIGNQGQCGTFGAPADSTPSGGGAGASFHFDGGRGGNGGTGGVNNAGGTSYPPFVTTPPAALRAGCRGQQGGQGGGGGEGGGAVYLAAGGTITLGASAIINASGAGALVAAQYGGGGGGGSGGMIILHAKDYAIASGAIIVANGGSGSTGGNNVGTGTRGNDPDPTNPMQPAPGPTGGGAPGGSGFAVGANATAGGNGGTTQGGGGGGGGGGYIQSNKALTNAKVSPAPNVLE
jgi:hypothetical protein